ncbi:transposase [Dehalococcoidia bacterium]|nr:transposase [Dehalococcoidia bacterium]MCL0064820.1 transposase [Dehalococcoidia bacterium]MCL0070400.1 transposase [Dehalococcoidia bacterium]
MARPLRLEYEGAVYHLTARGNAKQSIFLDDDDRIRFLDVLSDVVDRFGWICHAYCLMTNHYHLLIETQLANLSRGMQQLNGVYTQAFNRRHERVGHVLQGRFKAILVEKESHLLELARYVVLNPVRAKLVSHPQQWSWSSYRAAAGEAAPGFLTVDWILAQFGNDPQKAQLAYRQFVAEGRELRVWENLHGGVLLGSKGFVEELKPLLTDKAKEKAIPKAERFAARPTLASLFKDTGGDKEKRNVKIHEAIRRYGYTLNQVEAVVGLHYSTISRIMKKVEHNSQMSKTKLC